MLSKVLARAATSGIEAFVFPQLAEHHDVALHSRSIGDPGEEGASLREKLDSLEARSAEAGRAAFEAGKQEGQQLARAELQPVLARLHAATVEVLALRSELRHKAERDVVQLALLISKRVLHRQRTVDEDALAAIARVAFERLTRSESYRVTVHPQFAAAVASALPANHASRVQIDPDPACALGTLTIHSSEGTIDASIDAQLEEIARGLTDRLATT
jgi:flagellar assembly protein FliH